MLFRSFHPICCSSLPESLVSGPLGTQAPRIDLQLLKDIQMYKSVNQDVATAVLKKFLNHQWYLSEELVAFAFFDYNVSIDTKRMMLKALQKNGSQPCTKRITIKPDDVNDPWITL